MKPEKIIRSEWLPDNHLIVSELYGDLNASDIEEWEGSLSEALSEIKDNGHFRILVNMFGFKATDLDAHKRFRGIIPLTLADYGWKVGYVALFEESKTMTFRNIRGKTCIAAAHVHQDATKMEQYELRFGKANERFFTDPDAARSWIETLPL